MGAFALRKALVREVTVNLDAFELGVAVSKLYDFIWDGTATGISSWSSRDCRTRAARRIGRRRKTLTYVLSNTLKLLHRLCRSSPRNLANAAA